MGKILMVLVAIIVFLFIITVHEFGHFITAKLFKVKVPEFSIGFGPTIFKKKKGETQYSLRVFPLGGYVKMEGEDESSNDKNALCNKPVWQRMIIVSAGAVLNILMGVIIYTIIYSTQISRMPVLTVDSVVENTPAFEQMLPGDKIVGVNGNRTWYYKDFKFLINTISPQEEMQITIQREGKEKVVAITPRFNAENDMYEIGIIMKTEKINFLSGIKYGIYETFYIIKIIFYSLFMLLTGKLGMNGVSGPVGTVNVISQAASMGFMPFINLFAMLTVNVGIFNLLPFPALDGGRVFFMLIELIRRKPIDPEKEGMVHFAGLMILLIFMLIVTVNDVSLIVKR